MRSVLLVVALLLALCYLVVVLVGKALHAQDVTMRPSSAIASGNVTSYSVARWPNAPRVVWRGQAGTLPYLLQINIPVDWPAYHYSYAAVQNDWDKDPHGMKWNERFAGLDHWKAQHLPSRETREQTAQALPSSRLKPIELNLDPIRVNVGPTARPSPFDIGPNVSRRTEAPYASPRPEKAPVRSYGTAGVSKSRDFGAEQDVQFLRPHNLSTKYVGRGAYGYLNAPPYASHPPGCGCPQCQQPPQQPPTFTLRVGDTITLPAGEPARVELNGDVLTFYIPRGDDGSNATPRTLTLKFLDGDGNEVSELTQTVQLSDDSVLFVGPQRLNIYEDVDKDGKIEPDEGERFPISAPLGFPMKIKTEDIGVKEG